VDLCLILGNLLENAVEAASKFDGQRYLKVKVKFEKGNLLIQVKNSHQEKIQHIRSDVWKSTKVDSANHGIGLQSVRRTVDKYHGTFLIEDTIPNEFKARIRMYSMDRC
jgi:sensor histidine kinase regulating citrate/malate metabolism